MKLTRSIFAALLFALFAFPVITQTTGCKSPPSQRVIAYKSLRTVADAVDTAMTAYADAVVRGQVAPDTQHRVRELHQHYRNYFGNALELAQYDYTAPVPVELAGIAAQLTTLITQNLNRR